MSDKAKTDHAIEHMTVRGATSRTVRFTTYRNSDGSTIVKCMACGKEVR